jgi:para-aminobenzoate synthetase
MPSNGRSRTLDEEAEDAKRARELQDSIKNRAENLMIVDLLRNDLSRVCQAGTVRVAKLMDIESFATVHQMVSTIRGRLDPSRASPVDVLTACFPGGSMTGAPKLRTMELLDEIEEGVNRGPYSGCLGYISLDGSTDMNIVIRSAVLTRSQDEGAWHVSIGAGGAITSLSDGDDEYSEMMLKASTVMGAVTDWANNLEPDDSVRRDRSMNTSSMYTATHNLTHSYYR